MPSSGEAEYLRSPFTWVFIVPALVIVLMLSSVLLAPDLALNFVLFISALFTTPFGIAVVIGYLLFAAIIHVLPGALVRVAGLLMLIFVAFLILAISTLSFRM